MSGNEVFDYATFLDRAGGDVDLAKELVVLLLADLPKMTQAVQAAVTARDAVALERAAHALKGAVSNFAADPAMHAAEHLEKMGRARQLDAAEAHCIMLEAALEALKRAVTASPAGIIP